MIHIDKNIPLPPIRKQGARDSTYAEALRTMEIGDSFLVPDCRNNTRLQLLGPWAKRAGIKLTSSKINGDGIRFWRIA